MVKLIFIFLLCFQFTLQDDTTDSIPTTDDDQVTLELVQNYEELVDSNEIDSFDESTVTEELDKIQSSLNSQISIELLEPRGRGHAVEGACWNSTAGEKRYIAETQTRQLFQWRTKVGNPQGFCQFKIGNFPTEMKTLAPKDIQTEADGRFPCGRKSGFESHEFRMPQVECVENCVIELEYSFNGTIFNFCSDVILYPMTELPLVNKIQIGETQTKLECDGLCQNQASCSNQQCVCRPGYSGTYCETQDLSVKGDNGNGSIYMIILLMLALIGLGLYFISKSIRKVRAHPDPEERLSSPQNPNNL